MPPTRDQILAILDRLDAEFPGATYELHWENPLQLLVATILAAQCPDERVNEVTPALFRKYPDAQSFAAAAVEDIAGEIPTISFNFKKAAAIKEACRSLVDHFDGEVPDRMEALLTLPRVARKTANVVLNCAFRVPSGVIVDGHVQRVVRRLGLTAKKTPEAIERDLMALVPRDRWLAFGPAAVLLGRYTCTNSEPQCLRCCLADLCPKLDAE